jgi:hypothetical protein
LEEIPDRHPARAAHAERNQFRAKRGRNQTPLRGRVGVGKAATESAADPDRIMSDMPGHTGQHRPQRARLYRTLEGGVPYQRANAQHALFRGKPIQPGDGVDVYQVGRPRQSEIHHRDEALTASQHPAILRRQICEQPHRLL